MQDPLESDWRWDLFGGWPSWCELEYRALRSLASPQDWWSANKKETHKIPVVLFQREWHWNEHVELVSGLKAKSGVDNNHRLFSKIMSDWEFKMSVEIDESRMVELARISSRKFVYLGLVKEKRLVKASTNCLQQLSVGEMFEWVCGIVHRCFTFERFSVRFCPRRLSCFFFFLFRFNNMLARKCLLWAHTHVERDISSLISPFTRRVPQRTETN